MLSVSSQLYTYIAEVQAGDTRSVNAFEFWHARGDSGVVWLTEDLICAPASQEYVERIFTLRAKQGSICRRGCRGSTLPGKFTTQPGERL